MKKVKTGEGTSDKHHLNPKKTKSTADVIAAVESTVIKDGRLTNVEIATATGATNEPVYSILTVELGLLR